MSFAAPAAIKTQRRRISVVFGYYCRTLKLSDGMAWRGMCGSEHIP